MQSYYATSGGAKQRCLASERSAKQQKNDIKSSHLVAYIIEKWAFGDFSAVEVQQIASMAVQDGASHHSVRHLASLGSNGLFPDNVSRELFVFRECRHAIRDQHIDVATVDFQGDT